MFVWSFKSKLEKKGKENNDVKNICKKKKKNCDENEVLLAEPMERP